MSKKAVETPLMRQYYAIKAKHPDAILLFRVGDFYETFSDDAIKTSEILGITLTRRANGAAQYIELAGFPYHAIDTYLPKLVRAGQRVAICEQLEDPKKTKKIVKRGVTELITPGISLNENILNHKENNYLACVNIRKQIAGIAFLDVSTGEFYVAQGSYDYIDKLLNSFNPKEVLYERSRKSQYEEIFGTKFYTYPTEDWMFVQETNYERLTKQFGTTSLKGFGVEELSEAIIAAGAILHYLDLTHHENMSHISKIVRIDQNSHVWLDKFTLRNLEIFKSFAENGNSLNDILDKTKTPMGARLLKRRIALPLKDLKKIRERHDIVEFFVNNADFADELSDIMAKIGDMERLASRIAIKKVNPRDLIQLKSALAALKKIITIIKKSENEILRYKSSKIDPLDDIHDLIQAKIKDDPASSIQKGGVIAEGVSQELDNLRQIAYSSKDYLDKLQQRLAKITGISSLKIGFNNVFGYYLEVRNTYKQRVPKEWVRKQTLVGSERYINAELKEYEEKILGAEEKILQMEIEIYTELINTLNDYVDKILDNASAIADLDTLLSFAKVAVENNYVRPEVNDSKIIDIKQGRHPVIEQELPVEENYIPNDVYLDDKDQQIIIITGPNMAGKSALLRQTALIVLMAQIGCFVPAESAKIGYVDKIFTRVGASDNISKGESTFMVEMNEAANILNNITDRSLILFDELGRGTSTYDGISIAWAIVEYIHEYPYGKAKTLFATHYHELNEMEKSYPRIKNYNVSVKEIDNKIIFLRKLIRGGSEHSFGIHVAKMAGMPKSVIKRANQILEQLENAHRGDDSDKVNISKPGKHTGTEREGYQLSFFQLDDPVLKQIRDQIKNLDINNLTPIEALNKLNEIKSLIGLKK